MTPLHSVEMVIVFVHYLNCHSFWKGTIDMSLIVCRHTQMHVSGDKTLHMAYQTNIGVCRHPPSSGAITVPYVFWA